LPSRPFPLVLSFAAVSAAASSTLLLHQVQSWLQQKARCNHAHAQHQTQLHILLDQERADTPCLVMLLGKFKVCSGSCTLCSHSLVFCCFASSVSICITTIAMPDVFEPDDMQTQSSALCTGCGKSWLQECIQHPLAAWLLQQLASAGPRSCKNM